ncbi:MAG: hypothetical protein KKA05_10285 [Alphaproteobacteria bacterium]|nr:hypothetical protein [Alphaproteobacteria bacterium]
MTGFTVNTTWGPLNPSSLAARLQREALAKADKARTFAEAHGAGTAHGIAYLREAEHWDGAASRYGAGDVKPRPYSEKPSAGQVAYQADTERAPTYHNGQPRTAWAFLDSTLQGIWERRAAATGGAQ